MTLHPDPAYVDLPRQTLFERPSTLIDPFAALTDSMLQQFDAEFAWASLRLTADHDQLLAYSSRRSTLFPALALLQAQGRLMPDPRHLRNLVGWGELRYQQGTVDLILGRTKALTATEVKRFSKARQQAQQTLDWFSLAQYEMMVVSQEERARRLQDELDESRSQLSDQLEAVQEWAHDLLNDLVPLLGATEDLYEALHEHASAKLVIQIERQATRINQRVHEGLREPLSASGTQNLSRLTSDLAQVWGMLLENRQQSFTAQLPKDALWVRAREQELVRVLNNLLSNAQKYTPKGGRISLALWQEGQEACLEVRDTGIGMALELQRCLFASKIRGVKTIPGHGLGLFQVRKTLERLGGRIQVQSEPMVGTQFLVRFPLASEGHEVGS